MFQPTMNLGTAHNNESEVIYAEVYLEPFQISKFKSFAKIVNALMPLTTFAKVLRFRYLTEM